MAAKKERKEKIRVLQVEDNPGDARLVQIYAEGDPHSELSFERAESLAGAIKALKAHSIDLVLLDLNLPDSQGLSTLIDLMNQGLEAPVIVLTGMDDHQLALDAVKIGAQDYLIKDTSLENNLGRAIRYAMERHRLYMVQRELALRDELTGLYNRRGLRLLADQQFRLAKRRQEHISLLLADIDGMKAINDEFGHPSGDRALQDLARVMRLTFRTSDVLARIGGDEFVVLALDTDPLAEKRLIERWQLELAKHSKETERPYQLGISIGILTKNPDDQLDLEQMIAAADKSMYETKQGDAVSGERVSTE